MKFLVVDDGGHPVLRFLAVKEENLHLFQYEGDQEYYIEVDDPETIEQLEEAVQLGSKFDKYGNFYLVEKGKVAGAEFLITRE